MRSAHTTAPPPLFLSYRGADPNSELRPTGQDNNKMSYAYEGRSPTIQQRSKARKSFGCFLRRHRRRPMQVHDNDILHHDLDDRDDNVHGFRGTLPNRRRIRTKAMSQPAGAGFLQKLFLKRSVSNSTKNTVAMPSGSDKEDTSDHSIIMSEEQKSSYISSSNATSYQPPRVRFGEATFIEVPCWKDRQELWWSQSELEDSRRHQSFQLFSHESTRLYLNGYQDAHQQLTNGGDRKLFLPPALLKGLEKGHAGLECFSSTLEDHRRRRGREIVHTIVIFSGFLRNPEELREQAVRLNAPSRQWAHTMGRAHEGAVKYALSVGLLQQR